MSLFIFWQFTPHRGWNFTFFFQMRFNHKITIAIKCTPHVRKVTPRCFFFNTTIQFLCFPSCRHFYKNVQGFTIVFLPCLKEQKVILTFIEIKTACLVKSRRFAEGNAIFKAVRMASYHRVTLPSHNLLSFTDGNLQWNGKMITKWMSVASGTVMKNIAVVEYIGKMAEGVPGSRGKSKRNSVLADWS